MLHARGARSAHATHLLRHAASLGAIAVALGACSGARPVAPVAPVASCVVGGTQASDRDTLSIATMASVDPAHVPAATNAAERTVFAQLYETLIDVDCEGRARPALGASWALDATGTRVTFTLRDGARFWSGKPVTAGDVLAAWRATAARPTASGRLAREIAGGTTVVDDHTLIVSLPDTAWLVLASRALAVYEPAPAAEWPNGSGLYRVTESSPLVLSPSAPASGAFVTTRAVPTGDPRDAIDAGADIVITRDPLVVRYAAARANLATVPLPWTRTYVLAVPGAAPRAVSMLLRPDSESMTLRQSLARDAVHAEARGAEPPYWWNGVTACGADVDSASATSASSGKSNRVVYRRDDPIARGLAERLVALDARTVAAGLSPDELARALRDGNDVAYVLALPRASLSSCNDFAELRLAVPWLAGGAAANSRLVPLIDTRETAIVNRNRVAATADWRGTLHFVGMGGRP